MFAHIFRNWPRTMMVLVQPVNLGMIAFSFLARPHFNNSKIGLIVFLEEILIFVWFMCILILFMDQWRSGDEYMGKGWIWSFVLISLLLYLVVMIMECLLIMDSLTETVKSDREENLNAQDLQIEENSNDEVNLRMQTYNKLKMGEIQPNNNVSTPGDAIRGQSELLRKEQEKLDERKKKKSNVKFNLGPSVGQN